jgi:hypothetical protein
MPDLVDDPSRCGNSIRRGKISPSGSIESREGSALASATPRLAQPDALLGFGSVWGRLKGDKIAPQVLDGQIKSSVSRKVRLNVLFAVCQ